MGFLTNTPDDNSFALNLNAEANLNRRVAFGPLLQLGFTDDLTLVGLSGQEKHAISLAELGERFKLILQGGLGFVHAGKGPSDISFLIPPGLGLDDQINSQMAFQSDFLLNITDLGVGRTLGNNDANLMPDLTFGVRF
jgi:hypothetical protein